MPDFSKRSQQPELLDNPDIPFEDIRQNMRELNLVNTWLGGHRITIAGFKRLLRDENKISVCEIGCGGGDNLFAIDKWCKKNNINIQLTGIDINPNCIQYAKQQYPDFNFICSDYKDVKFAAALINNDFKGESPERDSPRIVDETASHLRETRLKNPLRPDIIFNSLFCHHFSNEEIIYILRWMQENSSTGFLINDLHRHPFAYYSIKWLTKIFSKSYLVKNDAPLSVLRGFTKREWQNLLQKAGISNVQLSWEWAFRHLIVCMK